MQMVRERGRGGRERGEREGRERGRGGEREREGVCDAYSTCTSMCVSVLSFDVTAA